MQLKIEEAALKKELAKRHQKRLKILHDLRVEEQSADLTKQWEDVKTRIEEVKSLQQQIDNERTNLQSPSAMDGWKTRQRSL